MLLWAAVALLPFSSLFLHVTASQTPLLASQHHDSDSYTFKWPVRKVAIIGAGPGGLISYREFKAAGFDVQVFERDNLPGGNWHYTEETPVDAPVPNADIAVGDYVPSLPPKGAKLPYEKHYTGHESAEALRAHRGPKPVWATLHSNAPAPVQQITEFPWPKGTDWELPHDKIGRYIRAFASYHGLNSNDANPRISFNTRVELVEKRLNATGEREGWTLTLRKLVRTGNDSSKAIWYNEDFDAVVIATGRYNAPNIPNIAGLKAWADRFPDQISHSRQYRRPNRYTNKTVLVVGAATSGGEISRDLNVHANRIYQSIRPDNSTLPHFHLKLFLRRLPSNVTIVPEIKQFLPPSSSISDSRIELINGTIISGIDSIIFATGFRYTFPFLPECHNPSVDPGESGPRDLPQPIVTDGSHLRSLYLDIFYIEEPTLGFVNMNIGMQSFTYAEYTSVALAKVWSNKAKIPSTPELWHHHEQHVKDLGGYGKHFQYLGAERTDALIRFFLGWLNAAAVKYGGRQLDGIDPGKAEISAIWSNSRFGADIFLGAPPADNLTSTDISGVMFDSGTSRGEDREVKLEDLVYSDYW